MTTDERLAALEADVRRLKVDVEELHSALDSLEGKLSRVFVGFEDPQDPGLTYSDS